MSRLVRCFLSFLFTTSCIVSSLSVLDPWWATNSGWYQLNCHPSKLQHDCSNKHCIHISKPELCFSFSSSREFMIRISLTIIHLSFSLFHVECRHLIDSIVAKFYSFFSSLLFIVHCLYPSLNLCINCSR